MVALTSLQMQFLFLFFVWRRQSIQWFHFFYKFIAKGLHPNFDKFCSLFWEPPHTYSVLEFFTPRSILNSRSPRFVWLILVWPFIPGSQRTDQINRRSTNTASGVVLVVKEIFHPFLLFGWIRLSSSINKHQGSLRNFSGKVFIWEKATRPWCIIHPSFHSVLFSGHVSMSNWGILL